jgi:putative two-component system hydrogenase maturation factor HypX/HoxX
MASEASFAPMLRAKIERRIHDERVRPLSSYRADEMQRMEANFYGFDPSFHVARYRFVHRTLASWTPLHLARHRQLGFVPPSDCVS